LSSIEGSGFSQIQRLFQFRIKPDADLLQAISEAISAEGIRTGVFISGLGALKKAVSET
jgi:predicted DNA-binding protein with PD1-like motif